MLMGVWLSPWQGLQGGLGEGLRLPPKSELERECRTCFSDCSAPATTGGIHHLAICFWGIL